MTITTDKPTTGTTNLGPRIEPLGPSIGARVRAVDLRQLTDSDVAVVHEALLRHRVLFFSGQELTDVTFVQRPPAGSILRAVTLPPTGGDTQWADSQAAYRSLAELVQHEPDALENAHEHSTGSTDSAVLVDADA